MPLILDGKTLASEIKTKVKKITSDMKLRPHLAVVLVGDDPTSQIYVRNKQRDCEECGIESTTYTFPSSTRELELYAFVSGLSQNPDIHGILVQLPLPPHIDPKLIISAISPEKDVDCFTPHNTGLLYQGKPQFIPCTPGGVIEMLNHYGIPISGKRCVVVGRSNIVGKPMAELLTQNNGTVSLCHSKTQHLPAYTRDVDILVSAVGISRFITDDMVSSNTVIVDVGMNRDENGKLCGDCTTAVYEKSSAYTPVPGGVGPMTRAMLMLNTVKAAQHFV